MTLDGYNDGQEARPGNGVVKEAMDRLFQAFDEALRAPKRITGAQYEEVQRERRQSYLGDSTMGTTPPPQDIDDIGSGASASVALGATVDLELCDGTIVRVRGEVVAPP